MSTLRLVTALSFLSALILLYYFTVVNVAFTPLVYFDRGASISFLAPFKLKEQSREWLETTAEVREEEEEKEGGSEEDKEESKEMKKKESDEVKENERNKEESEEVVASKSTGDDDDSKKSEKDDKEDDKSLVKEDEKTKQEKEGKKKKGSSESREDSEGEEMKQTTDSAIKRTKSTEKEQKGSSAVDDLEDSEEVRPTTPSAMKRTEEAEENSSEPDEKKKSGEAMQRSTKAAEKKSFERNEKKSGENSKPVKGEEESVEKNESRSRKQTKAPSNVEKQSSERLEESGANSTVHHDSIFIYRAYYDDRTANGTIRVLLISKCIEEKELFEMRIGSTLHPLSHRPVEGSACPWRWAPGCKWNALALESGVIRRKPKRITLIVNGTRQLEVAVDSLQQLRPGKLEICVPPLFWYLDWPRLVLFFEMWKHHDASFVIYVNSVSARVMRVLDHYKEQGLVRLVNWPMLPLAENGEDPNLSIYRLSHSLAHNDCVLRLQSEFGALLDIDEYLHLMDGSTLIEFAKEQLKKKDNLGSWNFGHRGLFIDPLDESFDGITNATVLGMSGPAKTLFRPETVRYISTHQINAHTKDVSHRRLAPSEGFLMHNRVTFGGKKPGDEVDLENHSPFTSALRNSTLTVAHEIFGDDLPPYQNVSAAAAAALLECNGKWRRQGCKVPMVHCREAMMPLEEWIFMKETKDSRYGVV